MTIVEPPDAAGASLLGGSIDLPVNAVPARAPRDAVDAVDRRAGHGRDRWPSSAPARWACRSRPSSPATAGRSSPSTSSQAVVDAINDGRSHVGEEPGLAELVAEAHAAGRLRATTDGDRGGPRGRRRRAHRPGHARRRATSPTTATWTRRSTSIGAGRPRRARSSSSRRRCRSATRATGTRRASRRPSGLAVERGPLRRVLARSGSTPGAVLRNLATYPKLVGGIGPASDGARGRVLRLASSTPRSWRCSSAEAAEFAKLADTTYRDVNIALANEFARYADRVGRRHPRGHRRGQQPAVQPHPPAGDRRRRPLHPGLPALPAQSRAPELTLVDASREVERRPGRTARSRPLEAELGGLDGAPVLVLGPDLPRTGVKELAYSRALAADRAARGAPARAVLAYDPLLDDDEVARAGRRAVALGRAPRRRSGRSSPRRPIRLFATLDPAWFPELARRVRRPQHAARRSTLPGRRRVPRRRRPGRRRRRDRRPAARPAPPGYRADRVRIVSVVGTRPQLIKAAALSPVLRARHDEILVDTGQHYDEAMAGIVLRASSACRGRTTRLGVGGGTHAEQTGRDARRPRADPGRPSGRTPSSSTATRTRRSPARSSRPSSAIPVAHVEAGLRSFDRRMPEEINRVVADHLVALAVRPDADGGRRTSRAEGIARRRRRSSAT